MNFKKIRGARALFQTPDGIWAARGMNFFRLGYDGVKIGRTYRAGTFIERLLSLCRITRQGLRLGIHHIVPLGNGNVLVCLRKRAVVYSPEGEVVAEFAGYRGNKPAHQGICVIPGTDSVLFAEYLQNITRQYPVSLWRSDDAGLNFKTVMTFPAGDIRHIHFVRWDPFDGCLWMGTGDYGRNENECRLYRSDDRGDSWTLVGSGSQDWRAIGVCPGGDTLCWGTDAGTTDAPNHLVSYSKTDGTLRVIEELEGPTHGCATLSDGRMFIATGVEGGANEKDDFARLKSVTAEGSETVLKLKKDIWPRLMQYGVMHFPSGSESSDTLVFTTFGLRGHGECIMIEKKQTK